MELIQYIQKKSDVILYVIADQEKTQIYEGYDCNVAILKVDSWNDELSPWFAKALKTSFAGQAEETLSKLEEIRKKVEENQSIRKRYFIGYSLAGLFAYYLLTKSNQFTGACCCSSSFWYPDFVDYVYSHPVENKRIYFSLGDQESKSRNELLATVGKCTEEIYQLASKSNETHFTYQPGGHFVDVEKRLQLGIDWIIKKR